MFLVNNSIIPATHKEPIDLDLLSGVISNITGSEGQVYKVVNDTTDYKDFTKHYSVLVDSKVTELGLAEFQQSILTSWQNVSSKSVINCGYCYCFVPE